MIKLIREHLSTKIFIITVCLLITVGSAIYGMVALGMSRSYFLELDRSLSNQTEKMVLQLSNTSVQEIDGILKMFALEHGISIVLKDSDEKVLGIYGDMEYSLAPGTDVEDILLGSGITESYSCKLTNGKTYWIQVFGNKEKVNIGLESLKRFLPMLGAITFLAALAIAALYTKYITRSILKVSEVSKKMANLDFRVRYTEDRRDEIGILGENLNELSEKLESALDELKEKNTDLEKSIKLEQQLEQQQMAFFSAVSHELKTPITILKGQIQGMLLEVGGYKDRDRYLKRSFEVANSMENMVQEILYVSKIRTSGFELKLIDIPLHQLVENVIKEQEDMAIDNMNVLQRGVRSVLRKPIKSIILLFIVIVMSGLFLGAMASRSASIYTQDATRQAIGATFRIEGNEENRRKRLDQAMDVLGDREGSYGGVTHKWLENGADMVVTDNSFETVKEDDVKKIAQVEGIEEYNLITIATVVNPVNFSRIEDSDMDQSTDVGGVNLRGNRIMEMDMDVSAGKISLIEGRMIEKDDRDVCVISKELAELNHLKTGNLLKFNDYHDKEHSTIYSAEIIGIYETKQERKSIMYGDSYRPENTIFTDMSFPEKPSGNEGNPFYQYAIFKVQNAGKYDQVKKSVQKANIDWSRYDLIDNNGNIKNMTENFGQMDQMSMGLLLIVSVSGLVILVLVFLFWIKNRTQEIGIMMSLGKCKFEIWVQFLWEAVMISIIGMLLSFAISPIIAETSASYLAKETQTLRLEQQEQENTGTYIDGYIAPDLKIQDVEVHITKEMVLIDIGMISGILIIAVLVAGITIMKKRPKQILSEMS